MQRNFKLILSIVVVLLAGALAFGQEEKVEYKDVVLDGKPAKLNVVTGEITLVDPKPDKKPKVSKADDFEKEEINSNFHIVEKGQTLYSLANRYGLTVSELKQQNDLTSNLIKVGQELRVANFNSNIGKSDLSVWTVSKGDTLYSIAKKNGLSVEQLKSLNGLTSNLIKVGQVLRLQ